MKCVDMCHSCTFWCWFRTLRERIVCMCKKKIGRSKDSVEFKPHEPWNINLKFSKGHTIDDENSQMLTCRAEITKKKIVYDHTMLRNVHLHPFSEGGWLSLQLNSRLSHSTLHVKAIDKTYDPNTTFFLVAAFVPVGWSVIPYMFYTLYLLTFCWIITSFYILIWKVFTGHRRVEGGEKRRHRPLVISHSL